MQQVKDLEGEIISAIKDFVVSIHSRRGFLSDMTELVDAVSQLPLANFDKWERLIRSELARTIESKTHSEWKFWLKPQKILTWLDLINRDGYKREKTLRKMSGGVPNAFFFSLAIRRLNDWVPQVRAAAREKLPLIAKETEPKHVVESLCNTLMNWNSWGRIEEVDKQVILKIICIEEVAELLKLKIIFSTSGAMSSLFSQLCRVPILDDYVEEIAYRAIQPSVRAKAYRSLFERRMVWIEGQKWEWTDIRYCKGKLKAVLSERKLEVQASLVDLLKRSSVDRSSIVRKVSAEFLIRNLDKLGAESEVFAKHFAYDTSNSVSERGRFVLRKIESGYGNAFQQAT